MNIINEQIKVQCFLSIFICLFNYLFIADSLVTLDFASERKTHNRCFSSPSDPPLLSPLSLLIVSRDEIKVVKSQLYGSQRDVTLHLGQGVPEHTTDGGPPLVQL